MGVGVQYGTAPAACIGLRASIRYTDSIHTIVDAIMMLINVNAIIVQITSKRTTHTIFSEFWTAGC